MTNTPPPKMKLEDLEAERAVDPFSPLPLPEREICDRYEKIFTAAVNDALRERKLTRQTLPNGLMPLRDNMRAAGFAFTIKGAKNLQLTSEMARRAEMLDAITENSFVVWDTSLDTESAHWGECMTMAAQRKHCRGAVVDGGVRDTDQVLNLGFPLWIRYRSSNGMLGRFRISSWQTPIQMGDVFVNPGDLIFADIDGALCVPRQLAVPILERAEEIAHGESDLKRWIKEGMSAVEIVKRGGYF
ncbi:RraA family protein [Opitutaceae bacterium TAV4]|nr:RraA family protein [Opitutaceae bacterium TAV4]RRK01606.1 RraA family protein [Opitutaceae bacterium TAV3]